MLKENLEKVEENIQAEKTKHRNWLLNMKSFQRIFTGI